MFDPKHNETLVQWLQSAVVEAVRHGYDDLTFRQLAILLITYGIDEMPTVRGLASMLQISRPAVSRALDRLCGDGLARRQADPRDRRSILVRRTPHGAQRLLQLQSLMQHATGQSAIVQTLTQQASGNAAATRADQRQREPGGREPGGGASVDADEGTSQTTP